MGYPVLKIQIWHVLCKVPGEINFYSTLGETAWQILRL